MRALITGANRGIGLELARQLLEAGHEVVATARHPERALELAALGREHAGRLRVEPLDVGFAASISTLVRALDGLALDLLINNAGVYPDSGKLGSLDYEQVRQGFEINALGPLRLTEALLPNLRAARTRKIAHVTSQMGSIEDNTSGGSYAYRMSKAALNMAHRSLANDLGAAGFICLTLHPGWVQTSMGGPHARLSVEQSASALLGLILEAGPAEHGAFLSWSGQRLPW